MSYQPLMPFHQRAEAVRPTLGIDNVAALEIYDTVIGKVDPARVVTFQERFKDQLVDFDPIGIYKYADLPFWISRCVTLAQRLKLDKLSPLSLLDIGAGPGHFAAVAQALGHRVVGTDIEVPLYRDIAEVLNVDRRVAPVVRGAPHPDVGGPFDRITIVWQVFDYISVNEDGTRVYWPVGDWEILLRDLASRHTTPGAILHLELNPHIHGSQQWFDEPLMSFCEQHGAKVDRQFGMIDLPAAGLHP